MAVWKIGILEPLDFSATAVASLRELGEVELFRGGSVSDFLRGKHAIFIRLGHFVDGELLALAPELRVICSPTTGLNHLDLDAVRAAGVQVLNLQGERAFLNTVRATPEHTLGLILALLRHYTQAFGSELHPGWERDPYRGGEVFGRTFGIIGMGRVGMCVAGYLHALEGTVIGYDNGCDVSFPADVKRLESLEALIEQTSVVIMCASLTDANVGMLNCDLLRQLRGKFLVNTARGELVDEASLIEFIEADHFAGVALDVLVDEQSGPLGLPALLHAGRNRNVIVTPHIAGATFESTWKTEEFLAQQLAEFFGTQKC